MWKKVLITLLFLTLGAAASEAVTVEVRLLNGTTQEALASYPLTLKVLNPEGRVVSSQEGRTDEKGRYRADITINPDEFIVAETNYRGVNYGTRIEPKDKEPYLVELSVYEITDKSTDIRIPARTLVISPQDERTIFMFDIITIHNTGNRTYVGSFNNELDVHESLLLPVPEGYRLTHLQGLDPEKVLTYRRAIITQQPIPPGEREYILGYYVRSDRGYFDLNLTSTEQTVPVDNTIVLFQPSEGWKIKLSGFTSTGNTTFFGKSFQSWRSTKPDSGRIKVLSPSYRSHYTGWIIAMVSGAGLSGLLLIFMRKHIRRYYLATESKRLMELVNILKNYTEDPSVKRFYNPMMRILTDRIRELMREFDTNDSTAAVAGHKKDIQSEKGS